MPTSDRAIQMRNFAEGEGLMTNARCLTEGVDLPAIDCVVFTDPKRSKVDIVQAAGRALRLSKGKKFGYILIPIFIPDGADFNEAAEEQGFDDVAVTVRALATTDTRITEYLRVISEGKKPKSGSPVDGITSVNSLYKIEAEEFDTAIKLKVWDKVAFGNWRSYDDAKMFALSLNITNSNSWFEHTKKNNFPKDIPIAPHYLYKKDWEGWGTFLGSGYVAPSLRKFRSYNDAKKYARALKLKGKNQWFDHTKSKNFPTDIPKSPAISFKNEWESWSEFLDNKKNLSYEDAKKFALSMKLTSHKDWIRLSHTKNFPLNIPKNPQVFYKNWENWNKFLGNTYRSYKEAKKYAQSLKLKNNKEWRLHKKSRKGPKDIPAIPEPVYKNEWEGWSEFLGNRKTFRSYKDAKKYAQSLKLKSGKEWITYSKSKNFPKDIQVHADRFYKEEWEGWGTFLGTGNIAVSNRKFKSYNDAKKYAQSLNFRYLSDWIKHTKSKNFPTDIPKQPRVYKKEWKGWPDFLGKRTKS